MHNIRAQLVFMIKNILQRLFEGRPAAARYAVRDSQCRHLRVRYRCALIILELALSVAVHQVLDAQKGIAERLEDTTQLECPGYLCRRGKEPEHLHGITGEPARQDRHPKPLAGPRARIREDLRERERRLDGETYVSKQHRVRGVQPGEGRERKLERGEDDEQPEKGLPVTEMQPVSTDPYPM